MMEEEDILDEMSGDHSRSNQETLTTTDDHGIHLPAWLAYLSLGFKVISKVIVVLMAGCMGSYYNQNYKKFTEDSQHLCC